MGNANSAFDGAEGVDNYPSYYQRRRASVNNSSVQPQALTQQTIRQPSSGRSESVPITTTTPPGISSNMTALIDRPTAQIQINYPSHQTSKLSVEESPFVGSPLVASDHFGQTWVNAPAPIPRHVGTTRQSGSSSTGLGRIHGARGRRSTLDSVETDDDWRPPQGDVDEDVLEAGVAGMDLEGDAEMKETGTNSNRPIDSERDYRNTSRIYHGAQPNLSSTTTQAVSTPGNSADNNPANNANEKDPSRPPPSGNRPSSPVEDRGTIPIMLTWTQGGHNVWITGTFNSWRTKIPLVRSHADFTAIIDMPKGMTHRFKFIVDDEWRCADDLPIASDGEGNLVNYLEVFDEEGKGVGDGLGGASEQPDSLAQGTDLLGTTPPDAYTNIIPPPAASSTRPPPRLPPHLDKVLLNAHPVSATDQALLPTPSNHVLLNHMYACSIRDGVMALGATVRYRQKYVTVVLYRPVSV